MRVRVRLVLLLLLELLELLLLLFKCSEKHHILGTVRLIAVNVGSERRVFFGQLLFGLPQSLS